MKEKILKQLKNIKDTIAFEGVEDSTQVYGLYIWNKHIFCLKNGMDIDFNSLTTQEQERVFDLVINKKYVVAPELQ